MVHHGAVIASSMFVSLMLVGLVAGILPAFQAMRLQIAVALGRHE